MEEVPVRENAVHSGVYAKKYVSSFLLKLFALVAMAYAGINFYNLFMRLKEEGFAADLWYVTLIYIFGYVFICVGLFSIIGKDRENSKIISELRTAGIGFGVLALSNLFNIGSILYSYFTYFHGLYSFKGYLDHYGFMYYLVDYSAAALSCIFAIFLIKNIIGAVKGDPAGFVMAILTAIFAFIVLIPWIVFFITYGHPFTKYFSMFLNIDLRILLAFVGGVCALVWIPYARKTNNYIFLHDPEEEQETAVLETETDLSEEKESPVQQEESAEEDKAEHEE